MRIIGGSLRGKTIPVPAGYRARPTTDFAKEGLFNILDNEYDFDGLSVLDLFGGSGTTLMACEKLGRSCRMMELSPRFCDVIIKRWEEMTGDQAIRIE